MSEKIEKAIKMMKEAYEEEFGKDATMESGEEMVGVFKDAVITLSIDEKRLTKLKVFIGEPYVFDEKIFEE